MNKLHLTARIEKLELEKKNIQKEIDALNKTLIDTNLGTTQKIEIFKRRFFARTDVIAKERENKKGYYPLKTNYDSKEFDYIGLKDEHILLHLKGKIRLGSYAITKKHRCIFLVIDLDDKAYSGEFSKGKALEDAQNIIESAKKFGINIYPELSKSGKGVHLWVWFSEPVIAANARRAGDLIINEAIPKTSLSISTFDRFFPSQDFISEDGLGNLIALPLHYGSMRQNGGTLFFDPDSLESYQNQFSFLEQIKEVETALLYELTGSDTRSHFFTSNDNFYLPPWERYGDKDSKVPMPDSLTVTLDNNIYIPHKNLSKKSIFRLQQLVSFVNPDYIKAQKLKKKIFNIPRILSAFEMDNEYIILPIGVLNSVVESFEKNNCVLKIVDKRVSPNFEKIVKFQGVLKEDQQEMLESLKDENIGIAQAKTGFGKTVVAIALASELGVKTLIIVTKIDLLNQWVDEIEKWGNINRNDIGVYSGSKKRLKGEIDIVTTQALANAINRGEAEIIRDKYGLLIVDECHHVASFSAYTVLKAYNGRYAYGFSATIERGDSKTPFVHFALGDVLYKNIAPEIRKRKLIALNTTFSIESKNYSEIISRLVTDKKRNEQIVASIEQLLNNKKLLLSDRIEHLNILSKILNEKCIEHIIIHGGIDAKNRAKTITELRTTGIIENLILATTNILGEGMDVKNIDTLILATPISHSSRLLQVLGRIGRDHNRELILVDFCDADATLAKLYKKRTKVYKTLRFYSD